MTKTSETYIEAGKAHEALDAIWPVFYFAFFCSEWIKSMKDTPGFGIEGLDEIGRSRLENLLKAVKEADSKLQDIII